jgi:hypothetical protein
MVVETSSMHKYITIYECMHRPRYCFKWSKKKLMLSSSARAAFVDFFCLSHAGIYVCVFMYNYVSSQSYELPYLINVSML